MRYKILIPTVLFCALLFSSCGGTTEEKADYRKRIPPEKAEMVAEWINEVVDSAYKHGYNGGELEDPEKVIWQARQTAKELFGEVTIGILVIDNGMFGLPSSWEFIPYWDCNERHKRMCDEAMKNGVRS